MSLRQARTKAARVDVALQSHPIMDRAFERMATLKARKPGEAHAFVVGEASVQRLVGSMVECANAQLARTTCSIRGTRPRRRSLESLRPAWR